MKVDIISVIYLGTLDTVIRVLADITNHRRYPAEVIVCDDLKRTRELIIEKKPDVILLDVIQNFLVWDFMDEINAGDNHTEIVLISKEKNFETAYQAFQHRAFNFLLCPIDLQTLIHTFDEVKDKKLAVSKMYAEQQKLDLYELKQHQELMEKILTNMLEKPEELELLLGEVNDRYQTELQNDSFQAIVINTDKLELNYEKSTFCQKVLQLIENAFPRAHEVLSAVMSPYGITGIINFSFRLMPEISDGDIKSLYHSIMNLQNNYGSFNLVIGVGTIVHSMKDVNLSLQEALRAEKFKLVVSDHRIFYASKLTSKPFELQSVLSVIQRKTLSRLLTIMEIEELEKWFEEMLARADCSLKDNPEGYDRVKEFIIALSKEIWCEEKDKEYFNEVSDSMTQLDYIFNGIQMLKRLKEIILSLCIQRKQEEISEISKPVQTALDYIRLHYSEAITLEELSEVCALSPNYFSAMFKDQIGETYIDYLTGYRLEQSKLLLINTKKTVKDIANEIGYLDDKYFRKLFKNRYGFTPMEFRKQK